MSTSCPFYERKQNVGDISIEKKLELIRGIRETASRNRNSLRQQQSILYGGRRDLTYDDYVTNMDPNMTDTPFPQNRKKFSTLGLRCLLAVLLFSGYVILDYTGGEWLSISASGAFSRIEENYSANGFAFIKEITYTLSSWMNTGNEK